MTTREYVPGHTEEEHRRLRQQAAVWEPHTAALLDRAGLGAGGICLDVGCGPGETMRLMAERVGPTGVVLGIEIDADLGRDTRTRLHADGLDQCDVIQADIESEDGTATLPVGTGVDLVFARFLLVHLADPVAALRRMWDWIAPGGTLIVQDYDIRGMDVHPPLPEVAEANELFAPLICPDFGVRHATLFAQAGIGEPDGTQVAGHLDRLDRGFGDWLTACYRSALPTALQRDLTTEDRAAQWFSRMAEAIATAGHHTALWPLLIGAHKRKPANTAFTTDRRTT